MRDALRALALSAALMVAACTTRRPEPPAPPPPAPAPTPTPTPTPPPPPPPATARELGVSLASPATLRAEEAVRALEAFRLSCPVLVRRQDQSGLANAAEWLPLCTEATSLTASNAQSFFRDRFDWVRVGTGEAFATGYYEPEIRGSRIRQPGYDVPIYAKPDDLARCYGPGQRGRGRVDHEGYCVLYYTRAEIEDGALTGRNLEIGWAADPIELFFLHIQGSGRLLLPDGQVMRIGYADQNGREYVAIGRLLRERGVLPPGGASMDAIIAWMRSQPDGGKALMRENPSYIFFKELTGPGPLGALNVPVTTRASVAADPKFAPLGAPVFLSLDRPEASGLWVAQDTGGAIKGANRFDTFWGAGQSARLTAGGMAAKGQALILLPKGAVQRAQAVR
ncbi:MAG TPA: murein transglycosylase A [Sphingomicrobium sp.]|nr:murein transglycosylase A [Sphingomicrobium sp.]